MNKGENMKKILSAFFGLAFVGAAGAADITLYYSPTCPHCHHARDFINGRLVYEYPTISVTQVNVMEEPNLPRFQETLKKCEYVSGGVPVIVVGEKCFQGYADFMQNELRDAVAADLSDAQKSDAAANKAALDADADAFKSQHADRANAVSEYHAALDTQKKTDGGSVIYFWGLLVVLVLALGFVLIKNKK